MSGAEFRFTINLHHKSVSPEKCLSKVMAGLDSYVLTPLINDLYSLIIMKKRKAHFRAGLMDASKPFRITSKQIEQATGLNSVTLHYYITDGALTPEIREGRRRGKRRLYGRRNLLQAILIKQMIELGVSRRRILEGLYSIESAGELSRLDDVANIQGVDFLVFELAHVKDEHGMDVIQLIHKFVPESQLDKLKEQHHAILFNLRNLFVFYIKKLGDFKLEEFQGA